MHDQAQTAKSFHFRLGGDQPLGAVADAVSLPRILAHCAAAMRVAGCPGLHLLHQKQTLTDQRASVTHHKASLAADLAPADPAQHHLGCLASGRQLESGPVLLLFF